MAADAPPRLNEVGAAAIDAPGSLVMRSFASEEKSSYASSAVVNATSIVIKAARVRSEEHDRSISVWINSDDGFIVVLGGAVRCGRGTRFSRD